MLVGAVVEHQVHHDADAPLLTLGDQLPHVLHGAEHRVDGPVIGDIIPVVHLGRGKHGREPNEVNAQLGQVVQPLDDSPQVSGAAAGGVLKALGVNLVDDDGTPPVSFCLIKHVSSS